MITKSSDFQIFYALVFLRSLLLLSLSLSVSSNFETVAGWCQLLVSLQCLVAAHARNELFLLLDSAYTRKQDQSLENAIWRVNLLTEEVGILGLGDGAFNRASHEGGGLFNGCWRLVRGWCRVVGLLYLAGCL